MDKLKKLKDEASKTHEGWGAIRGQRAALERRQQELRGEAGEVEREASAYELLPEHDRPKPDENHSAKRSTIDAELQRLDRLEIEACALKDEAAEELQREVRKLFPAAIERVQEANSEVRDHLADLGQSVVRPYLKLLEAQVVLADADAGLATLQSYLAGGDRRATFQQKNEVKGLLDAGLQDVSDFEILGQIMASIIRWSRRGSSPIEDLWTGEGLPVLDGSVLNDPPHVGDVLQFRARRLPRRAS